MITLTEQVTASGKPRTRPDNNMTTAVAAGRWQAIGI
jgi:hypothetical protein